jgi:hypothetical protein
MCGMTVGSPFSIMFEEVISIVVKMNLLLYSTGYRALCTAAHAILKGASRSSLDDRYSAELASNLKNAFQYRSPKVERITLSRRAELSSSISSDEVGKCGVRTRSYGSAVSE